MPDPVIKAVSSELTEQDIDKQSLVKDLIKSQNRVIVDFAKQLVTVSFSAIGVVLALRDKWLGQHPSQTAVILLAIAIAAFLTTGLMGLLSTNAFPHRVTLDDYDGVYAEVQRVARARARLTSVGFGAAVTGVLLVALVALSSV